jgi:hypothetical protein
VLIAALGRSLRRLARGSAQCHSYERPIAQ